MKVLLVDDEQGIRKVLGITLSDAGYEVYTAEDGRKASRMIHELRPDIVLTDIRMPGMDGLTLMSEALVKVPKLPVILLTAHGDVDMAIKAMRDGAYDFIEKPYSAERLVKTVFRGLEKRALTLENRNLRRELELHSAPGPRIIGRTPGMEKLRSTIAQVADTGADVLIFGETGTGKELVANMIRETSNRETKPFLKINCNTINDSLLESDLFGYERGAFTGAHARTKGKFEVVDGGTIFLDEIGDISPRMQAALLRVLQDGEIIRVGGNTPIQIDVRIIAATNRDLALAVQDGSFRLDLFYRLNIINISIPPLRQRKEDIEDLVSHFVRRYRIAFKKDVNFVPKPIIDKLTEHDWPGNVRELENVIQRAVLMTKNNIITEQEIFFDIPAGAEPHSHHLPMTKQFTNTPLKSILSEVERDILIHYLKKYHGNVSKAADELRVGKTAFYDKLKRYGISSKDHR